ncbi:Hsp20/alpha crystallin family protein [Nibribacter koreensis]
MTKLKRMSEEPMAMTHLLTDVMNADRFFGNMDRYFNKDPFFKGMSKIPAANIKEKTNHFEIEVATPGMDREDIHVDVSNNLLTITAEHKKEKQEEKGNYSRKEFSYSSFNRSFTLPDNVNADKIDAHYKNGVLELILPKKEGTTAANKKQVKIS